MTYECPICDQGTLSPNLITQEFCYKGHDFAINTILYSICNVCGSHITTPEQAKENEDKIRIEHRKIDRKENGLLSGEEIKRIRKRFNLTKQYASEIFGGGVNAFSKYEKEEILQSVAMDRLLRLIDAIPSALQKLIAISQPHSHATTMPRAFNVISDYDESSVETNDIDRRKLQSVTINADLFDKELEDDRKVANS